MADEDFQVFELRREIQLKWTLLRLLFLLARLISIVLCQTKIKWRVPYDGLVVMGNGLLGVKSAGKEEELEEWKFLLHLRCASSERMEQRAAVCSMLDILNS